MQNLACVAAAGVLVISEVELGCLEPAGEDEKDMTSVQLPWLVHRQRHCAEQ